MQSRGRLPCSPGSPAVPLAGARIMACGGPAGRRRSTSSPVAGRRTNLTFASLVAREWLRRRLPAQAARPGGTARAGTAGVLPVPSGPARWPGGAGWTGAAERAAESEEAAEPGWAADPEWAAEPAEVGDREQPAAWGKRA